MKKIKFALSIAALGAFTALPVLAQHGGSKHDSSSASMHAGKTGKSSSSVSEKLMDNTKLATKLRIFRRFSFFSTAPL